MDASQLKEEVIQALNGEGAETPPAEAPVSEPPVKVEAPQAPVEPKAPVNVDPVKLQEQISNLNTALAQERNEKKQDKEKITALEESLKQTSGLMDRMKNIFVPEEPQQQKVAQPLTKDELLQILEEREVEKQQKTEEQKRGELIQNEIKELETTFSGKDGGLKYDDQEVLQWQKENNKLYLTPKEAFSIMRQKEIIDYQVREVLAGRKQVVNVETPNGAPVQHEPPETLPKNDQEMRAAILEAMENASKEL